MITPRFNRSSARTQSGFTLVELLIAMALVGIVLAAVVTVNIDTSKSLAVLQTRNDLLPETQIAQNYLVSKLREAAYLFPKTASLNLGTDYSTRNPRTGDGTWSLNTDAAVAFIVPPRKSDVAILCTAATPDYCYTFYAYYPVKRSVVTAAATLNDNPGPDPVNDLSDWVLMEYRAAYTQSGFPTNNTFPSGGKGKILMDYLLPTTQTGTDVLFSQTSDTTTPGVAGVTLNLAGQRSMAGKVVRLPVTGRYTLTVYPRNLGKTPIAN
jgi:prepilin-type N-terminal cleavage/methylation domain-containing protein